MKLRSGLSVLFSFAAACGSSGSGSGEDLLSAESRADDHRYELPAAEVWAVAEVVVAEDGAVIESRRPSSDGGEVVARRPEGSRIQAIVAAVESSATRVVVAVTPPNGALASMIQGRIAERLSLRKAQADLFGEISVEAVYSRNVEICAVAVEETCGVLDLDIVRRMALENQVRVEARDREGRTVRFTLRRIGDRDGETAVMFAVERAPRETLDGLRGEFERHLSPAGD